MERDHLANNAVTSTFRKTKAKQLISTCQLAWFTKIIIQSAQPFSSVARYNYGINVDCIHTVQNTSPHFLMFISSSTCTILSGYGWDTFGGKIGVRFWCSFILLELFSSIKCMTYYPSACIMSLIITISLEENVNYHFKHKISVTVFTE